jgi:hypothetical protein
MTIVNPDDEAERKLLAEVVASGKALIQQMKQEAREGKTILNIMELRKLEADVKICEDELMR